MVYCCQNHSGSPALTAPVPKKALTPCATVYGFNAPLQTVWQTPLPTSHDVADVNASLHALKQLEHAQEEAAGIATSDQPPCLAANLTMATVTAFLVAIYVYQVPYALQAAVAKKIILFWLRLDCQNQSLLKLTS